MNPAAIPSSASDNPRPGGPSNLRLRVIWGALAAALLIGCTWGGPVSFGLFFAAVQAVILKEFYRIMRASGYRPASWLGGVVGVLVFGWLLFIMGFSEQIHNMYLNGDGSFTFYPPLTNVPTASETPFWISILLSITRKGSYLWLVIGALLVTVLLIREIIRWPNHGQPFANVAATLAGLFYVSLPMSLLNTLAFYDYSYAPRYVFCLILLVWAADTGAYFAGRAFGKHKLAPAISPGKTWEGWAGGLLLTLFAGWVVAGWLLPAVPLGHRLVAAGVVAVFGPLGDLAESMLKRSAGVKDSGTFLPGHGGLLDRFDAFLLVLPVLALLRVLFS